MSTGAVSKLTARQRDCLRLVLQHKQSKEIGRELGISPTTVDNHFRSAMQILGVSSRIEAALLLAAHERGEEAPPDTGQEWADAPGNGRHRTSQRLTSQPPPLVSPDENPMMALSSEAGGGQGDMVSSLREDQVPYRIYRDAGLIDFPLPVPTMGKPNNDLSIAQRLFWIAVLIVGMGLGAGALLSGFATLTQVALALKHG